MSKKTKAKKVKKEKQPLAPAQKKIMFSLLMVAIVIVVIGLTLSVLTYTDVIG